MDWLLEKCTELGVHAVVPVMSERCEVQLADSRAVKRREHWQRVVLSACEQCGRAYVPEVGAVQELATYLAGINTQEGLRLTLEPGAAALGTLLEGQTQLTVAVGPEGVDDDDQLKAWIERAIKFVRTLPKK